jgi:enoyl-CoA hydratase
MQDILEFRPGEGVLDILLTDPDGGNLISNAAGERIVAALASLDPSVRLIRLMSTGETFCLGRVSPMPKPGAVVTGHGLKTRVAEPALAVYGALRGANVPVLAVVRGAAHGFGAGLVAAADIAIATPEARFAIPEMARDIPPTLVMTAMLDRVSAKAVADLVIGQHEVDAAAALGYGLVSRVVPADALDAAVEDLTARARGASAESIAAVKEYWRAAAGLPYASASSLAANLAGAALSARFGKPGAA